MDIQIYQPRRSTIQSSRVTDCGQGSWLAGYASSTPNLVRKKFKVIGDTLSDPMSRMCVRRVHLVSIREIQS